VEKDENIGLSVGWKSKLSTMKSVVEGQKADMKAMIKLNDNKQCCWELLLRQFEQTLPNGGSCCGSCSYSECREVNVDYIDNTQVDSSAGDSVFYRTTTPAGFEVYGLANTSDRVVNLDLIRVQRVLASYVPGVYLSPPSCALAYVPGRSKENETNMKYMAEQLNLGLMLQYARVNSGFTESCRNMKTKEAKQQLVKEKYEIDANAIPKAAAGQQVILYDDVVCSGCTFDRLAEPLKTKGYHVIGLVSKIWRWGDREAEQFSIVDCDDEDAKMEPQEQKDYRVRIPEVG
jgi:hypothetical protein